MIIMDVEQGERRERRPSYFEEFLRQLFEGFADELKKSGRRSGRVSLKKFYTLL